MVSQKKNRTPDESGSRTAILDAATEAFMESGFSGARVEDIATRARANKAMIYYHFSSKLGLYRAVLMRLFGDVLEEVERLKDSGASSREKLHALYTRIAHHFGEKPALPPIMLREILAGGKSMDAKASHTLFTIVTFVSETVQEGVKRGEFRKVHPLLLHMSILSPLLVHFAGAAFRERVLTREMPGVHIPSNEDMLGHLLIALDRSIALTESPSIAPSASPSGGKS